MGLSLGRAMALALNKTARCPGYYATTRYTLAASSDPAILALQEVLSTEITKPRACFMELQSIFAQISKGKGTVVLDAGSITPNHARSLAELAFKGVGYALTLLQQLMSLLQSDRDRRLNPPSSLHQPDPWRVYSQHSYMQSQDGLELKDCELTASIEKGSLIGDWLGRFSLTMGASRSSPTHACSSV
ncbi:hypothetical protein BJX70DRAFT_358511 [Aspergillus crustosus]